MLGALVVSLGLDAADFISGMSKSEQQAKKFASNLDRAIVGGIVKAEIALRALGTAARTGAEVFDVLTSGAAKFQDLAEDSGATAEAIASLQVSATGAGVEIESVVGSINKMTKGLVGVDDESKAAGAALKALGLNVAEFKKLDPVAQYEAVGKALAGFEDGASKTAVAMALFGKAGAEQLRVFKDLEAQGGRQVILTQKQIEAADAYGDAIATAGAQLRLYAQAAATQALPALSDLSTAATDFLKSILGVDKATGQLAANNGVKSFATAAVDALAFVIDAGDGVVRVFTGIGLAADALQRIKSLPMFGGFAEGRDIVQQLGKDLDTLAQKELFSTRLANQRAQSAAGSIASSLGIDAIGAAPSRPKLTFNGPPDTSAAADAAKERKRLLDGQIKDIRAFAEEQRQAFEFANQVIDRTYDEGLISLRQSFDAQQQIRDQALQSTVAALDREIEVLQAHARKAVKPEERIDAENKIAEAIAKRSQVAQRSQQDTVLASLDESRAIANLQSRYEDLRATILELSGDTRGASSIRIGQQVNDARKLLAQSGQDPAIADTLGQRLTDTERLRQSQSDYNSLVDRARMSEESILLSAREYGATELETLRAVGSARAQALAQMAGMVSEAQQLAAVLGTDEARRYADGLAVAFQRAAAEVDPLLLKVRRVGEEMAAAIVDPISEAIIQWKSWSDLIGQIERQLLAIGTRELITKPAGDFLSNVIGGNGSPSGGGGLLGSLFGAGSGAGKFISGLFGGFFADGGRPPLDKVSVVGERGPELFVPDRSGTIVPNNRAAAVLGRMSGNTSNNSRSIVVSPTFHLSGPMNLKTQKQIAAETARSVAAADARLN